MCWSGLSAEVEECCRRLKILSWAQGVSSKDFVNELGYLGCEEIVHRDNICLLQRPHSNLSEANLGGSMAQQAGGARPNGLAPEESAAQESSDRGMQTFSPGAVLVLCNGCHSSCMLAHR